MKPPTITTILCTASLLLALAFYGCNNSTNSNLNKPELMTLDFTRSSYAPGQTLVIRATPNPDLDEEFFNENALQIQLSASSGQQSSAQLSPWSDLTDEEMAEAIKNGPGRASIRIKKADQESARNSDGKLVRSEEAMSKFEEWVKNHDKLSVSRIAKLSPYIFIEFLKEPTADVVKEIRSHKNVEFIEPVLTGEYLSTSDNEQESVRLDLAAVLPSDSFTWQGGDTVTAKFQQSDGTILKATAHISDE